jgi:transposase
MPQRNDLSRSLVPFQQDGTLVAVVELSRSSWLVAAIVPGLDRRPLKKLEPDEDALLRLLRRWRDEAAGAGHTVTRLAVAFEAGRDGFWLARWLRGQGVECDVIHPTSVSVSREHRRAKTDRLDLGVLKRSYLGWLRGEKRHCSMVAVPTREAEDAKRPLRERDRLVSEATRLVNRIKGLLTLHGIARFDPRMATAPARLRALRTAEGEPLPPHTLAELLRALERLRQIREQIAEIEAAQRARLKEAPEAGVTAMIRLVARVRGVGVMTAELLVREALSRPLRDRRAVARYAGATGAPDESGSKRREKGLAKAGNARVRRVVLQLAWRFLRHQPDSALVQWFRRRTQDGRGTTRKTMIVALARKLLIALWELATTGAVPPGVQLHAAS